ncbi:MAG: hypothetical protein ABEJ42_00860 [Halobacteriaceae archaeon]
MHRALQTTAVAAVALALLGAGCLGAPAGPAGTDGTTSAPTTEPPTTAPPTTGPPTGSPGDWTPPWLDAGNATAPTVLGNGSSDSVVVDTAHLGMPLVEGGLTYDLGNETSVRRVTIVLGSPADRERLNRSALNASAPDAAAFVAATDLASESLLVYQVFPDSSVPDARVLNVTAYRDTAVVNFTDASDVGTADITLETLFVRVPDDAFDGDGPTEAVFVSEEASAVGSG